MTIWPPTGYLDLNPPSAYGIPRETWYAELIVTGRGNTEQEALDNLLLGYLSILDTDGRAHAVRFAQALCGAIEAGRCHE